MAPTRAGAQTGTGEATASDTPASAAPAPKVLSVLLVDDNAPVLRFLSMAFGSSDCVVSTAAAAEDALALLADKSFDLVVSDIMMPGLSGLDLLREVKGKQPDTPVVLITGQPSVESAVFGLRHQAYDYLAKPFPVSDVHTLLGRVRRDLEARAQLLATPADAAGELARRQLGIETISQMAGLALQETETAALVEKTLDYTLGSLGGDVALLVLRDEDGNLTPSQKGDAGLAAQLFGRIQESFAELLEAGAAQSLALADPGHPGVALAAVIQGPGKPMGLLCLGRRVGGDFRPDEKEFLFSYARTIALALAKILLGENLEGNLIDTISSFVVALEAKDPHLKGHSARVSLYAGETAKAMGLSSSQVGVTRRAAILHDLGKLGVMDAILRKPGRLTAEEDALMRAHPASAVKILKPLRFLAQESDGIEHHHERYDGKGYPDGLKGEDIPLVARIIAVADAFDAMTTARPYRQPIPLDQALQEIRRHARAQFDPTVSEAFASIPLARLTEISRFYENRPVPDAPGGTPDVNPARPASLAGVN